MLVIVSARPTIYQTLITAELTGAIGAALHERSAERCGQRNGHRARTLTTTAAIWSCGSRSCAPDRFPSLLERRRRVDQTLFTVMMEGLLARGVDSQGR